MHSFQNTNCWLPFGRKKNTKWHVRNTPKYKRVYKNYKTSFLELYLKQVLIIQKITLKLGEKYCKVKCKNGIVIYLDFPYIIN